MRKRLGLTAVLLVALTCALSAQFTDEIVVGAELSAGYTIVNLSNALGWDDNYFEEWDQIFGRVAANVFFYQAGPVTLGASVAWNRLYYYWVRVPYVPSPLNYEGTVQPVSIGAVGELPITDFLRVRSGASLFIFGDGVTVGVRSAVLYRLPITTSVAVSAGGTVDVIFGSGVPVGVGLDIGVDYALDLR